MEWMPVPDLTKILKLIENNIGPSVAGSDEIQNEIIYFGETKTHPENFTSRPDII